MTIQELAARFEELAQSRSWEQVQEELYDENIVSIEPAHVQVWQTIKGITAITQKREMFEN